MQAVAAISAAAPSLLPHSLQQKLCLAQLAVTTALQALSLIAHNTGSGDICSTSGLEALLSMAAELMQRAVTRPSGSTAQGSAAAELYVEQLTLVAACCQAVAGVKDVKQVTGWQQLPQEELVIALLEQQEHSQSLTEVQVNIDCTHWGCNFMQLSASLPDIYALC